MNFIIKLVKGYWKLCTYFSNRTKPVTELELVAHEHKITVQESDASHNAKWIHTCFSIFFFTAPFWGPIYVYNYFATKYENEYKTESFQINGKTENITKLEYRNKLSVLATDIVTELNNTRELVLTTMSDIFSAMEKIDHSTVELKKNLLIETLAKIEQIGTNQQYLETITNFNKVNKEINSESKDISISELKGDEAFQIENGHKLIEIINIYPKIEELIIPLVDFYDFEKIMQGKAAKTYLENSTRNDIGRWSGKRFLTNTKEIYTYFEHKLNNLPKSRWEELFQQKNILEYKNIDFNGDTFIQIYKKDFKRISPTSKTFTVKVLNTTTQEIQHPYFNFLKVNQTKSLLQVIAEDGSTLYFDIENSFEKKNVMWNWKSKKDV